MSAPARQETMLRKPILMPPSMIEKVDKIAKSKNVSFAQIVREAVNSFDSTASNNDVLILEALANTMIDSVKSTLKRMNDVEKRLDKTHNILEAQDGN